MTDITPTRLSSSVTRIAALFLFAAGCFANPTPHPGSIDAAATPADSGFNGADTAPQDAGTGSDIDNFFGDTGAPAGDAGAETFDPGEADGNDANVTDVAGELPLDAGPDGPDVVDAGDTGFVDSGAPDAGPTDSGAADSKPTDTGGMDSGAMDAGSTDTGAMDGSGTDTAGGCTATFEIPVILRCGDTYTTFLYWSDWGDPSCPTWYTPLGSYPVAYDTLEDLAAATGCGSDCVYDATTSVSFLTCDGPKSGYDVYSGGEECPGGVYGTPDGIFEDLCDWDKYACYCDDTPQ